MKKALIVILVVVLVIAAGTAAATTLYLNSDSFKSDKFPEGVSVNGVDCSGLSYEEAESAISKSWNKRKIAVTGDIGEQLATFTDFGYTYDLQKQLKSVKRDNLPAAALNHFLKISFNATIGMKVVKSSKKFEKKVKHSDFLVGGGLTDSQNAYVDLTDPDFNIVKEVYGTKPDVDKFYEDLTKAIETGDMTIKYDKNNYIDIPDIKSDDEGLLEYQEFCRETFSQKITYEFGDDSYTIPQKTIISMFTDDMSGDLNKDNIKKFVKKLAKKYDTAGESIHMKSLTGRSFTVNGGTYGWIISQDGEYDQLKDDLRSHKDVTREPVYSQKGEGKYSSKLGDTYVDVDLKKQHVTYFKKGKKKFDCDCVSGCVSQGHDTPTGIYYLNSKGRNITLKGGGKKGSSGYYESFVSYWMPFIGQSIGLHDASWRSSFGGSIYKTAGSHGCVNLPVSKAAKLYDIIEVGTPVVVHN